MAINFNEDEKNAIFEVAQHLTGTFQQERYRCDVLVNNVGRRMLRLGIPSLEEYLLLAQSDPDERAHLVSACTIHTTSWFRELPHFRRIENIIKERNFSPGEIFRVWSAACSTGEEVYTVALVLEEYRRQNRRFDYEIVGTDIDPISVEKAQKAIYKSSSLKTIPSQYRKHLMIGQGKTEGLFTLGRQIRTRCRFKCSSITDEDPTFRLNHFDLVMCRNVLIYFEPTRVPEVVENLTRYLKPGGHLVLGHSEAISEPGRLELQSLGRSTYLKPKPRPTTNKKDDTAGKRVLVIDDSPTICRLLTRVLAKRGFTVASVESAEAATKYLEKNKADLITLDLNMPGQSGKDWLADFRNKGHEIPVVIVSEASVEEAHLVLGLLERGAQDYIEKKYFYSQPEVIIEKLVELLNHHQTKHKKSEEDKTLEYPQIKIDEVLKHRPDVILVGASTGGPDALRKLLAGLPPDCPPVVVVQHISPKFLGTFAEKLASHCRLKLGSIRPGSPLRPGHLYAAVEDSHVEIIAGTSGIALNVSKKPPINTHRPSAEALFRSALQVNGNIVAVLLTGMGRDGSRGLLDLRKKGAYTMAQDKESSVVFGMPGEALRLGAPHLVGNPEQLRMQLMRGLIKLGVKKVA